MPMISTKLYIPQTRTKVVLRPRLMEILNEGLRRKLSLISASAGSGKTTLVSEWLSRSDRPVAWLSMDEGDNDPVRLLTYLIAALQTIKANIGEGVFRLLQIPQPPPIESMITALLNEIAAAPDPFILVLDDYHVIHANQIDNVFSVLLERMPTQMHMVIVTREDPRLPLARLRVRDQLTEVRATDLRFTFPEASQFLGQVMGLNLSSEDIAQLEFRTEGWIAGLQLAALSMQGHKEPANFIQSFTGSHPFVLDYLIEEVLQQRSATMQHFLLRTSILDRFCGSLCDAVLDDGASDNQAAAPSGQAMLEELERANLFIIPLDYERRWYRYHHLFADLLRRRLSQRVAADLHIRASEWYENNRLEIEAFHHAAAANDVERAARLMEGGGMPLLFRGALAPVLGWLDSIPEEQLDAKPSLWVMYASANLMTGQTTAVEQKLQAAERALRDVEEDDITRDLIGHIAAIRATLAVSKHQAETINAESRRALAYLRPDNLPVRTAATCALGYAYQLQGDRAAARQAYAEALSNSEMLGHFIIAIMASLGIGILQEGDNELHSAAETYRRVLKMAGDSPLPVACGAHLGLARICYEWNDLDGAMLHGQQAVQLAKQVEHADQVVASEVILARLQLALGEASRAADTLAMADQIARRQNFVNQMPHIAAAQALVFLHQGKLAEAAHLAQKHKLPISQARVYLAQGDALSALAMLKPLREQAEAKGLEDERLKIIVLEAVAYHEHGDKAKAAQLLEEALTMAKPSGFIRLFVDEGVPMYRLLREASAQGLMSDYLVKLLAASKTETLTQKFHADQHTAEPLMESLSARELEVLRLIAQGLSNQEISEQLFIALTTVKGHNRIIFDKLRVKRRTEAVARAREQGLL